ncbi:hypothetical protein [Tetragenococcus halophilus]|uniref:hypothetical protein n=1 Tax=Tetragenococcus halophilus TaxID=51669 RepID=UPI0018DFAAB6|nr:hypothetical protein [Tetragenococcus halophilus]MDN6166284.1 hypothetical protein [Tetragenococcus koreensis]MDN6268398.1 hypothetical protein [Tetragenococcus koreensis]MDN6570581.1 hypothetical protein [Staphylococcus equorum]MDN6750792.1 hypothetical protein [Staphylococcus equorum]
MTAIETRTKPVKTENPKLPSTKEQRTMTTEEILEKIPTLCFMGCKENSKVKNDF